MSGGFAYMVKTLFSQELPSEATDALRKRFGNVYFSEINTKRKHYKYRADKLNPEDTFLQNLVLSEALSDGVYLSAHTTEICKILSQDRLDEINEYNRNRNPAFIKLKHIGDEDTKSTAKSDISGIMTRTIKQLQQIKVEALKPLFMPKGSGQNCFLDCDSCTA